MSTILPHGIIQIDEGNTSWYNNITDNWQLIDSKIGEYDTAIATIPAAANDGVLTIAVNGTAAGAFSANQAGNATVDIPVPTRTSQLTNDSDFITSDAVPTVNDGTLTIKVNGATAGTFTANQATNEEINITAGGAEYASEAEVTDTVLSEMNYLL